MKPIVVTQDGNALLIKLPAVLGTEFVEQMITDSKGWLLQPVTVYIYDFKGVVEVKAPAYRGFVVFARLAKQGDRRVASINLISTIDHQIKNDGVLSSFNPAGSTDAAMGAKETVTPKAAGGIDVALINPFVQAIVKTLGVQAQTPCQPGKPFLQSVTEKTYSESIGIVGIINLSTARFSGSIALVFSEKTFLQIYENMFAEKHTTITNELQDAAAEILNIIYGTAKTQLNQLPGYDLQPVIPTVLAGERMKLHQKTNEKIIILPFESSAGAFQLEIAIESK